MFVVALAVCLRVRLKDAGGMQVCASTSPFDKAQARASFVPSEAVADYWYRLFV